MNINTYEDTVIDVDSNSDSDIAGFHMADSSTNKKAIGKAVKKKDRIRQKLDSINEKKSLDGQLNSYSDYWEF